MNKKSLLTSILLVVFFMNLTSIFSQNEKYWVFFSDKKGVQFDPISYFDAKTIEHRLMQNIPINDISDYPVREDYINTVSEQVISVGYASRWFNALSVTATEEQIKILNKLPFVIGVQKQTIKINLCEYENLPKAKFEDNELAIKQLQLMQAEYFKKAGITGKGIRIAIFDGGFPEVDKHDAFAHVRKANRIIKTWDFCKNKEFVYSYNSHGLSTMSNICGIYEGIPLGLATESEFLLARTEVNTEPFAEEEYWLAAVEWADKNGAQIISSSLGYTSDRYFPEQMNGKKSLVVRAANMAASKGIVVVNAMGNDGDNSWKAVGTPADADSIISVGGIDPYTEYRISFSSYGPTFDGRMKPNVTNSGHAQVAEKGNKTGGAFGTSFATPLTSGFVACAMQMMPGKKTMEMIHLIEQSGNLYPYYDYAHGFGVPQASFFTKTPIEKAKPSFDFKVDSDSLIIETLKTTTELDTTSLNESVTSHYLYYHIVLPDGKLFRYGLISVSENIPLKLAINDLPEKCTVRVLYQKYIKEWKR